jgi:hypothetical protein
MSLDFYLEKGGERPVDPTPEIYYRHRGRRIRVSREEYARLEPGREPVKEPSCPFASS